MYCANIKINIYGFDYQKSIKHWLINILLNKKSSDYLIIFFFALNVMLNATNAMLNVKKITPKAPIIYGMPILYIFIVVGQISLIRYPKIQNIAEMIMSIIPIIKNPFFISIFYSLSSIIKILINIRLSSLILYKMKESLFFSFDFEQKLLFFGGFTIENK